MISAVQRMLASHSTYSGEGLWAIQVENNETEIERMNSCMTVNPRFGNRNSADLTFTCSDKLEGSFPLWLPHLHQPCNSSTHWYLCDEFLCMMITIKKDGKSSLVAIASPHYSWACVQYIENWVLSLVLYILYFNEII